MNDEEYIESVRKARAESVRFFSNAGRPERELWVATEFVANLGLGAEPDEFIAPQADPPDIRFRGAEFEIKEIMEPGRQRHREYMDSLRKAERAKKPAELLEDFQPRDIAYAEIVSLVQERTKDLQDRYAPGARKNLDLLFYVNLEDAWGYVATPLPPEEDFASFGWRSISFVAGPIGCNLYSSGSAPAFLRAVAGRAVRKPTPAE